MPTSPLPRAEQVLTDTVHDLYGGQQDPEDSQVVARKMLAALTKAGFVVIPKPNTAIEQHIIDELTNCISDAISWVLNDDADVATDLMNRRDTDRFLSGQVAIDALKAVLADALVFTPDDIRAQLTGRADRALACAGE